MGLRGEPDPRPNFRVRPWLMGALGSGPGRQWPPWRNPYRNPYPNPYCHPYQNPCQNPYWNLYWNPYGNPYRGGILGPSWWGKEHRLGDFNDYLAGGPAATPARATPTVLATPTRRHQARPPPVQHPSPPAREPHASVDARHYPPLQQACPLL